MSKLGTLVVEVMAEIRKYQADMNAAAATTEATTARIEAAVEKVQAKVEQSNQSSAQSFKATASQLEGDAGRMIARLQKQHETFGMSADQVRRWEVANVQATDSQRALLDSLLTAVEAQEAQASATAAGSIGLTVFSASVIAAAAVLAGYAVVAVNAARENTAVVRVLALTSNQAGLTQASWMAMSSAMSASVGTYKQASDVMMEMVSSGKVATENLNVLGVTALNAQRSLGISAEDMVKNYEKLADEPVKATLKLNEAMGYLNAETYRRIAALEDMGLKDEAAALAQLTYASAVDDATKKVETSLGTVQKAWRAAGETAKKAWDWFLGLGREAPVESKLSELRAKLAAAETKLSGGFVNTAGGAAVGMRGMTDQRREQLQLEAEALREQISLLGRSDQIAAQYAANSVEFNRKKIEAIDRNRKAEEQLETQAQKRAKAIELADKDLEAGYITAEEHRVRVAAAEEKYADKVKKTKQAVDEFAQALERVQAKDAGLNGDYEKSLSALYKGYQQGRIGAEDYAKAVESLIKQQPFYKAGLEEEAKAQKLAMDAAKQRSAERQKEAAGIDAYFEAQAQASAQSLKSVKDRMAALEDEAKAVEMSATLNISLAEAVERVALARLKEQQAKLQDGSEAWLAIQKEIDARERLIRLVADKSYRDEAVGWWRSIENTAHSVWTAVTEQGQSAWKRIGNTLKSAVLDLLWQITGRQWLISLGVTLGVPGAAMASAGGSMATSGLGSLFGGFGSSVMEGFGVAQTGVGAGVLASSGSAGFGLGQTLGSIPGWGWAIAGLAALASMLDSGGTPHGGGIAQYSADQGLQTSTTHGAFGAGFGGVDYNKEGQDLASGLAQGVAGLLDTAAAAFGRKGGYSVATGYAADGEDPAWGALRIALGGQDVLNWDASRTSKWAPREFGSADEYKAAVAKDVQQYLIGEAPGWAATLLKTLGDSPTIETLASTVNDIAAVSGALDVMGRASQAFAGVADETVSALIKAMGGAQSAVASLSWYYDAYYSEAERSAILTAKLTEEFSKLGLSLPTSRDGLKGLIDAAIAAGDTDLAAKLISLAKGFADISSSAEDAAKATADAAQAAVDEAASRAMDGLRRSVEAQKSVIQTQMDAWTTLADEARSIWSWLDGTVASLRQNALSPVANMAMGQQSLNAMLSAALGTGALPDQTALEQAVSAISAGINAQGLYGNETERRYAQLALAGQLDSLEGVAGNQLTEAERQLVVAKQQLDDLDKTLNYWQQQVDLSKGNIDATLGVTEAIVNLQEALKPGSTKKGKSDGSAPTADGPRYISGPTAGSGYTTDTYSMTATAEQIVGGLAAQAAKARTAYDQAIIWSNGASGNLLGSAEAVTAAAIAAGASASQAAAGASAAAAYAGYVAKYGKPPTSADAFDAYYAALPKYADGGWHSGGWAIVGEQGPELAYMPPAQIYTANQTASMLNNMALRGGASQASGGTHEAAFLAAMQALIAENQGMRAELAQATKHMQTMADKLSAVVRFNAVMTSPAPTVKVGA